MVDVLVAVVVVVVMAVLMVTEEVTQEQLQGYCLLGVLMVVVTVEQWIWELT